jgi:hypothetical protein
MATQYDGISAGLKRLGREAVQVLRYKPEGRVFDTDEANDLYQFTEGLEFTQPLTEMRTRSIEIMFLGSRTRPVREANNPITFCKPTV